MDLLGDPFSRLEVISNPGPIRISREHGPLFAVTGCQSVGVPTVYAKLGTRAATW